MKILILAGDLTNFYLHRLLKNSGYKAKLEGFSHLNDKFTNKPIKISGYKTIVAPLPFSLDGSTLYSPYNEGIIYIDQLLNSADKDSKIVGGPFSIEDKRLYDFTKNKYFTDKTVIPTCEEILKIIIDKSDKTINGLRVKISGEGRVNKKLTSMLTLLNAKVLNNENLNDNKVDVLILTTSDHMVTNKELLSITDTLIIDITNIKHTKEISKKVLKTRGLPGKSAPESVAQYLYSTLKKENFI